jgi:hypothetical protein
MPDWMEGVVRAALSTVRPVIGQGPGFLVAFSTMMEQASLSCVRIQGKVGIV